jgi:hypothetical protein
MAEQLKDKYDIPGAAVYTGLSPQYIRNRVRDKTIPTVKEPISEGAVVFKHLMTREALDAFLNAPRKNRRADHRNKYVVYMTRTELVEVQDALKAANLHDVIATMHLANIVKPDSKGKPHVRHQNRETKAKATRPDRPLEEIVAETQDNLEFQKNLEEVRAIKTPVARTRRPKPEGIEP